MIMHNQGTFASFCLGLQKYIVCMVKDIIPSSCKQEQPQINSKKNQNITFNNNNNNKKVNKAFKYL